MPTDLFQGLSGPAAFFDGDDHTWLPVYGLNHSDYWDFGAAVGIDDITIKWHYGGAFWQDGSPGPVSGAAAGFVIEGSADLSSWTAVVTDANPVGTAGASYPGDFSHTYSFSTATYRYWRFRSTGSGNNDIYTISGFADTPPEPLPDPEPGTAVDFDEDGFGSGDELITYVTSWRIERGAGPSITDGANPGRATVMLQNPGDIFNPQNTSGPYYGKLRDGLPLWIGVNSDGAYTGDDPRGLFGGRTANWTPMLVPGATAAPLVELTAEDALAWFRRTRVRVENALARPHRALRTEMLNVAGESHRDLAHEIARMPVSSFDGDLLSGLEAINKANGTRHFVKPEDDRAEWYSYVTRNRQWRLDATTDAAANAGTDHVTGTTGMTLSADTVINQQKASATPIFWTPSSHVVWEAEGLPWNIFHNRDKTIYIEFDDYVKTAAVSINYSGGAISATLTNYGMTAKVKLHYGGVGVSKVTSLKVTGSLMRRGEDVAYVADDEDSQAGTRGVRAGGDIGPQFVPVLAYAEGIAKHVVWRYATPQLRPTLTVANWIPEQFEIDLYDTIAVTIAEGDLSARLFEVVGLTHEASFAPNASSHHHVSTFVLQECRVQDADDFPWFYLDDPGSELDDPDKQLAY